MYQSTVSIAHFLVYLAICIVLGSLSSCQAEPTDLALPERVDFNFHVRPILSNHCFTCHGPDSTSRKAGLRLDTYAGATAILRTGHQAIDPDHWRKSTLITRITSDDPEVVMPPPEANNPLAARDVALLQKWIRQGAEWQDYWAFIPPDAERYDPTRTIDDFIQRELDRRDLQMASPADKPTLIRRLAYVLTGLPPDKHLVDRYLQDSSAVAYEKIVDQLLASPRFGERWARHWMDLARYAETMGHEFDYPVIGAWRYRDYLIRAFNQDLPYDQFIREQLAGDLLETPRYHPVSGTNESLLGTLFYTLGEGKHSPVDIRQEEVDRIDNMIDVTAKTFQGLTLACARCHDHKFDPLPTTDYYALYGVFESTRITHYPADFGRTQLAQIDSIKAHQQAIRTFIAQALTPADLAPQALPIKQTLSSESQAIIDTFTVLADFRRGDLQGWQATGPAFTVGNALGTPIFASNKKKLKGFATAKASSRLLGEGIQGNLRSSTFMIEHDFLTVRAAGNYATIRIIVDNFQLIQNPIYGSLAHEVDQSAMQDYTFDLTMVQGHKAYVELLPGKLQRHDFSITPEAWLEVEYAVLHQNSTAPTLPEPTVRSHPLKSQDLQAWAAGETMPAVVQRLHRQLAVAGSIIHLPEVKPHLEEIDRLSVAIYTPAAFTGVSEGDHIQSPVFVRGDHKQLATEPVPHRYLTVFADQYPSFPEAGSGRLNLANAIADHANPLTARVLVNRIWHHLLGKGLVETVDNFGLQGKIPSHPELLDHLALQFIEQGWSVKQLIKTIVLSATFRQSATASPASAVRDPANIWLHHFPVRRLEAEAVRDGILAASGQLDTSMYGPSVPIHLTPFMQGRGRPSESGALDGDGRRSIYQSVRRNFLQELMQTFDQPTPFSTFGRRNITNVPAQSLTLLNDPFVHAQAQCWAERLLRAPMNFSERLQDVYFAAFTREPTDSEIQQAEQFFQTQGQLLGINPTEVLTSERIWADFCQAIYNTKEFIFIK